MMRQILKFILPKNIFQKIENESKKWFMECDKCSYSISYWDSGGIRAGATSTKKKVFGRCPNCKEYKWLRIIKKEND